MVHTSCALCAGCSTKPAAKKLWRGEQFDHMFPGLSEPLPICVVFISFHIPPYAGKVRGGGGEGGSRNSSAEGDYEKEDGYRWGRLELLEMLSPFLRASARRRTDVGTCGDRPHMLHPIHRHSATATMVRLCAYGVTQYINLCSPEHRSV